MPAIVIQRLTCCQVEQFHLYTTTYIFYSYATWFNKNLGVWRNVYGVKKKDITQSSNFK